MEWVLLRLVKSCLTASLDAYWRLLARCSSGEWRAILNARLENWEQASAGPAGEGTP